MKANASVKAGIIAIQACWYQLLLVATSAAGASFGVSASSVQSSSRVLLSMAGGLLGFAAAGTCVAGCTLLA